MRRLILPLLILSNLTACGVYRMPDDDDLALIPTTNNPEVIEEKAPMMMPGFSI